MSAAACSTTSITPAAASRSSTGLRTRVSLLGCALLLAACGGSNDTDSAAADLASPTERRSALAVNPSNVPVDAATKGMWGPVKDWPLIGIHGVLLSDGRMLSYGSKQGGLMQTGWFVYDIYDPKDDSHLTLPNGALADTFCGTQLLLPDGSGAMTFGGDTGNGQGYTGVGQPLTTVLPSGSNSLTRGANMRRPRWYASSTALLNGEVYIQGGLGGQDRPEIRGLDGTYRLLNIDTNGLAVGYPRNFIAPNGQIFGIDEAGRTYFVNLAASSVTQTGQLPSAVAANDSGTAMYAPGRVLIYGGNSNQAMVVDVNGATPATAQTGSMLRQRRSSTATILADGQVVATGGSSVHLQLTGVSLEAETWNPRTGQWQAGASAQIPRLYHSNALLLPDATVMAFGGGTPGPLNNINAEVYYPPYLFSNGVFATRPTITSAPTVVNVGRSVQVGVGGSRPIKRLTLVKTGSVTHSVNMDQRFVDLPFSGSGSTLTVQIPSRASDVPPGMWMLFAFDDAGVPSVASMLRVAVAGTIDAANAPTLAGVANQTTASKLAVSLGLSASDPQRLALTYSAAGLPQGLSINPGTGVISGTPTSIGTHTVAVAASNGITSATQNFIWTVTGDAPLALNPLAAPAPAQSGASVTFDASASGTGLRYSWDFGDGTPPTAPSTSASASHVFSTAGVYYVTVTVTDNAGVQQRRTTLFNAYDALYAGVPSASSTLAYETPASGNARLWVVNPDNDSVSVLDAVSRTRLAEIAVGSAPRTLALAPNGTVWVTNKGSGTVSVISTSSRSVLRTVSMPRGSQPYGVAWSRAANAALVVLEGTGNVVKVDGNSYAITASLPVGANPRHVTVGGDGATAFVMQYITPPIAGESGASVQTSGAGRAVSFNATTMTPGNPVALPYSTVADSESGGRGFPNYLGAMVISPDGSQAYIPSKQDNIVRGVARDGRALTFDSTVRAVSSRVLLDGGWTASAAERIDHDNASVASAAAFDPLGVYLFVALETSREVAVIDAHKRNQIMRIDVGRAPQGLVISPDRRTLFVMNFMDRTVSAHDLTPLVYQGVAAASPLGTIPAVAADKLAANVLNGKQLFYDARDTRLARDRYMSCATCHNDGGHDGRVWDLTSQAEGLRNTLSLRGRAGVGQGFLHWSANFDEVQDFEGQIRTLAGGTGLMSDAQFNTGTVGQPLGDRKAGRSADLDALATYVQSLSSFASTPWRSADGGLTAAAQTGKAVFNTSCASCHGGAGFTKSADASQVKNIGTLKPTSGNRLGGTLSGIDIPTLRDAWATAPYLHDGSAPTLAAAVTSHNNLTLNATDLANVVAYVQQIGNEEGAGWQACATEGGSCAIPAGVTADVYYGANGTHMMRSGLTGSVTCGMASFGGIDPVPGVYKSCSYVPTGTLVKVACGGPGNLCSLPAGAVGDVYYGTASNYAVRTGVTAAVCGNAFIDTNRGAAQTCSYVVTATANPPPATALTACSGESGTCALPAGVTADVYYGANGKYALRTGLTGNVGCNTTTFGGDPVPYVVKSCAYVVTNSVSKTSCAGEGAFCALPGGNAGSGGDVYYGGGGRFAMRSGVTGTYCNAAQFGGDPNPGVAKTCTYVAKP